MSNYKYAPSMFIGETTRGARIPVPFDPHSCVWNNLPGGTVIYGSPGSGKTYLALDLTAKATLMGKRVVVIDPKNDFIQLAAIQNDIGKFDILNLASNRDNNGNSGILDPFYLAVGNERLELVLNVIEIFLGELTDIQRVILIPIIKDVASSNIPSMELLVSLLNRTDDPEQVARGLATRLDMVQKSTFGNLCFAPHNTKARKSIVFGDGLTIISLGGLDLPVAGSENKDPGSRLATGIMYLLTYFLRNVMMTDKSGTPKLVVIDEAQGVAATAAGQQIIKKMSLLGRSVNLALVLVTQNITHFGSLDLESAISNRFCFRSSSDQAIEVIRSMDLPMDQGYQKLIPVLRNGECLMKDCVRSNDQNGRVGTVQISQWKKSWRDAFETNPYEKAKKLKEQERANAEKARIAAQEKSKTV